jgi:hypothetical protein
MGCLLRMISVILTHGREKCKSSTKNEQIVKKLYYRGKMHNFYLIKMVTKMTKVFPKGLKKQDRSAIMVPSII